MEQRNSQSSFLIFNQRVEPALMIGLIFFIHLGDLLRFGFVNNAVAVTVLLLVALFAKSWNAVPALLLYCLMFAYWLLVPKVMMGIPILSFLLPAIIVSILMSVFLKEIKILSWAKVGVIDHISKWLLVGISLVSALALLLWAIWTDHLGAGVQMMKSLGNLSPWLKVGIIIPVFAFLNALAEEFVYRGILFESLQRVFSNTWIVMILQACAFAIAHLAAGFPNGMLGYLMTFAYALMLGYLRLRTQGILASLICHILADLFIGYWLLFNS